MDEEERKRRQKEQAEELKKRWAQNAPEFQKGFLGEDEEKKKKSQWSNISKLFGG